MKSKAPNQPDPSIVFDSEGMIRTTEDVLALAAGIAGDDASVTLHHGAHGEMAIRVGGCFKADAEIVAGKIAAALPGKMVSDGGFVAVWF
jgi:hypothetical protein